MNKKKALVVFSGGQDSTTCLYWAISQGWEVHAVTFDYGQRHVIELESAAMIAGIADIKSYEVVTLGPILKGASPLVSSNELDQYANHQSLPGGLEKTFVPMRNQLFLTVAANRAFVAGCETLVTGVCEEDYGGYPDCRQVFIESLQQTCNYGTFNAEAGFPNGLTIATPLMKLTKAQSVHLALTLPGCYLALAYSHTAYDGRYPPVGHDHASLLRAKGFEEAGVPDPLVLRAVVENRMEMPSALNYSAEKLKQYKTKLLRDLELWI